MYSNEKMENSDRYEYLIEELEKIKEHIDNVSKTLQNFVVKDTLFNNYLDNAIEDNQYNNDCCECDSCADFTTDKNNQDNKKELDTNEYIKNIIKLAAINNIIKPNNLNSYHPWLINF